MLCQAKARASCALLSCKAQITLRTSAGACCGALPVLPSACDAEHLDVFVHPVKMPSDGSDVWAPNRQRCHWCGCVGPCRWLCPCAASWFRGAARLAALMPVTLVCASAGAAAQSSSPCRIISYSSSRRWLQGAEAIACARPPPAASPDLLACDGTDTPAPATPCCIMCHYALHASILYSII